MALEKRTVRDTIDGKSGAMYRKIDVYTPEEITRSSAIKKQNIVDGLSESDQLNLLATVLEQIGDLVGLNTPEFIYAKAKFAEIKAELARTT